MNDSNRIGIAVVAVGCTLLGAASASMFSNINEDSPVVAHRANHTHINWLHPQLATPPSLVLPLRATRLSMRRKPPSMPWSTSKLRPSSPTKATHG